MSLKIQTAELRSLRKHIKQSDVPQGYNYSHYKITLHGGGRAVFKTSGLGPDDFVHGEALKGKASNCSSARFEIAIEHEILQ